MSLNKATGDMYPWVTHTHTHLRGACPHACPYCYARKGRAQRHYKGPLRMAEKELSVNYGTGKVIFVEHMQDLFAVGVDAVWVYEILDQCRDYPGNTYVFQTRAVSRLAGFLHMFPPIRIIGTTVESNLYYPEMEGVPHVADRLRFIGDLGKDGERTFVTVEPIMDFTRDFAQKIINADPDFVNIGADSKGCGLREPLGDDVDDLVMRLRRAGLDVRLKPNLSRIIGRPVPRCAYPDINPGHGAEAVV